MPPVNRPELPFGDESGEGLPNQPHGTPPVLPSGSNLGGSPGLVTSTGGLFGLLKVVGVPFFDVKYKNYNINVIDPFNFDTEESAFYYFPSPDAATQNRPGIPVTVNNIVIVYRELGLATFFVGVIVYNRKEDKFIFKEIKVNIVNRSPGVDTVNFNFPDQKLHTVLVPLVIDGERPQAFIRRIADSGPLSIQSLTLIGVTDTKVIIGK